MTDCLEDAIDYSRVYELISAEMSVTSLLLENVAGGSCNALLRPFPLVNAGYGLKNGSLAGRGSG